MSKFSKFGASALALALSFALVSPVTANAKMTDYNRNADGSYTATSKETGKSASYTRVTEEEYSYKLTSGSSDFANTYYNYKKVKVQTGRYNYIDVPFSYGQVSVSKVKIKSGKDVATVKVAGYTKNTNVWYEDANDAGTYYIIDPATGERIKKTADATAADELKDYGAVQFRIYGKKAGNAVIQYQINDANGNKVATKKIKVTVGDTGVKSVKFAGKEIYANVLENAKSDTYFNKKSGKLKVTMNKGYALKNIYVITDPGYEDKVVNEDGDIERSTKTVRLDLNGDGDCLDTIDGISESEKKTEVYTKVKNGKKIKLGSEPYLSNYSKTFYDRTVDGKDYKGIYENSSVGNVSSTRILIIYQDKLTKVYDTDYVDIYRTLSKK
ncbi:hypothetical protein [Butyrivibrio sp. NC2002]|uniref:hypothetical protein n=1 Tax=Butyrivibrio sp. NC2002 TaxID=1410610 RepID=UPI000562D3EC|nr:hypothetical protein [Butyrivibrio sp. NC2002]